MNFSPDMLAPELLLLLIICGLFVQSLQTRPETRPVFWLPYAAILTTLTTMASLGSSGDMLHGAYRVDGLSQFFKLAVAAGLFLASVIVGRQPELEDRHETDYHLLLVVSAWGLMLLASCVELVTMIVALEISSFCLFGLVPLRADKPEAAEAGVKYVLFGAAATGVSLYGLALLWAAGGSTYLADLGPALHGGEMAPLAVLGLAVFFGGFFYKLALFPFHFWAPDVYAGASNETAAVVATLPKLGAVVVLVRLAALLVPVEGLSSEVTLLLAVLGAASMTLGNLMALAQRDVKRLLGFSSVSHAGYITLGLVSGTAQGLAAASFYALVYLLMNLCCFFVISRYAGDGRNLQLDDLDGMHQRAPLLALALAVSAFALVGLPPTAGFTGKLFLLTSAWGHGYDWLVVVAAVNTAISIFYYLSLVRHAYTHDATAADLPLPAGGVAVATLGGLLAAMLLLLGLIPGPMYAFAALAGKQLLP